MWWQGSDQERCKVDQRSRGSTYLFINMNFTLILDKTVAIWNPNVVNLSKRNIKDNHDFKIPIIILALLISVLVEIVRIYARHFLSIFPGKLQITRGLPRAFRFSLSWGIMKQMDIFHKYEIHWKPSYKFIWLLQPLQCTDRLKCNKIYPTPYWGLSLTTSC